MELSLRIIYHFITFTAVNSYQQIIIGAGFAGICMAIRLKQAGQHNFIVLERNPHIGGTWWDNAYPGAACDVESHLYSYSFEPKADWTREFSPQQEILEYLDFCAAKYDVNKHIQLNTSVTGTSFNEETGLWTVKTADGKILTAKALISCSGGLSQPALPAINGLENFKGKMFHSARWDKSFEATGKKVAVIGTGASAIQIVPAIAPQVKQLALFQRTPPWIIPKPDGPISNFRKAIYKNLPFTRAMHRGRLYWTHELMAIGFTGQTGLMKILRRLATGFINKSIADDTLRKKVTPTYMPGCKRILLSNDYYPALQLPNVEVVTDSIKEITERGVLTVDGKERSFDAIIFATGFNAAEGVVVYDVKGKNGLDLNEAWKNGAEAYLGTTVNGFPNMFLVVGPNTGLGHSSMILMIEAQVHYIMECLKGINDAGAKYINIKRDVQVGYNTEIQEKLNRSVWQTGGCHSWYQNKSGKNVALWPGFTFTFMKRTKQFDAQKYELVK